MDNKQMQLIPENGENLNTQLIVPIPVSSLRAPVLSIVKNV